MSTSLHRLFVSALAAAALTPTVRAEPVDEQVPSTVHSKVICLTDDPGAADADGHAKVFMFRADGDGPCNWVVNGDDGQEVIIDSLGGTAALALVNTDPNQNGYAFVSGTRLKPVAESDPSRGWLGVNIGEVSPAMASQLGLEGRGVMIVNIVKDSPAEEAGLQRHDIVTAVNGQALTDSAASLANAIAEAGESATVELTVLRGGKERTVNVTLSSRPDDDLQWVHDFAFGPSISEQFRTRGKVLQFRPDGDAFFRNLGDLKDLRDLPDNVRALIPNIDDIMTNVWVDTEGDVTTHVTTRVNQDGQTIEIERKNDEEIIVRRKSVDEDGNKQTTVNTYGSAEALEEGDAEAFDIYSGIQGPHVLELDLDGLHDGLGTLHLQLDNLNDLMPDADIQAQIQESLDKARDAYSNAMKLGPKFKDFKFGGSGAFFIGRPAYKFNVDSDGGITATLRKGDSEVVLNFDGDDDLRQRRPDLYEKFAELTEDEEE
ncbi:MAG: S1C family serine protease [Phycisphaerae bacterium]